MYLQVEITSRCNLKCKMCPLTLGATASSGTAGLIEDADWEQVKRLSATAGRIMLVGFGEPMTHPRFVGMLQELDKLGVEVSFSTNGIGAELIAPRLALIKHLRHVNISIDSPDPKLYEDIRGGDVNRALSGMRAIAAALPDRVDVTVNSVVMKQNVRSLIAFPAILRDAGIRLYALNGLHDYANELRGEHIHTGRALQTFLPNRRMHTVLDELKAECVRNDVQLLLTHRTQLDFYKPEQSAEEYFGGDHGVDKAVTRACTVPFDSMYVDSNGKVFPCCHAAGITPLGDLRSESVEAVWTGRNFAKFRNDLLDVRTTPQICRSCTVAPFGEHPFNLYRAEILAVEPLSGVRGFRMRVRNCGTRSWGLEAPLRLAPSRPNDRASIHHHPSWMSPTRVCGPIETGVPAGQVATLEFEVTPAHVARPEHFQLLIEGKNWLPDTILQFPMPEPPPLELRCEDRYFQAAGATFDLNVTTPGSVPWVASVDCDWIRLQHQAGKGSGALAVTVLPNWQLGERIAYIRIGNVRTEVIQSACEDDSQRIALLCYWKLLGRIPSAAEIEPWRGEVAAKVIQGLLADDVLAKPQALAGRLFMAFLEKTPRPGRWRGVIRDADDSSDPTEIINRFLALTEVRALFTPDDNSALPS
jgi:radical SAM protein with 4Fe4S-binding SPASM domain